MNKKTIITILHTSGRDVFTSGLYFFTSGLYFFTSGLYFFTSGRDVCIPRTSYLVSRHRLTLSVILSLSGYNIYGCLNQKTSHPCRPCRSYVTGGMGDMGGMFSAFTII